MKLSMHRASLALSHLVQRLHLLKNAFREWPPQQGPALIPIPIPTDRRAPGSSRRHPHRDE